LSIGELLHELLARDYAHFGTVRRELAHFDGVYTYRDTDRVRRASDSMVTLFLTNLRGGV